MTHDPASVSEPCRRLLVYVGGLTEKRGDCADLFERLRAEPGHGSDSVWIYPDWVRPTTRGRMDSLAASLSGRIDGLWADRGKPAEIVLIGHSIGGVLLRYAYLLGLGRLGSRRSEWSAHVSRIVLLAAPNRGVPIDRLRVPMRIVTAVVAATSRKFAALDVLAGSPFMTNLRLEWVRQFASMGAMAPLVVHIGGLADPLVKREDSRDVESRENAAQFLLPRATHGDIVRISGVPEDVEGERYRRLSQAIIGIVAPTEPEALPGDEDGITDVVILLHGIRAGLYDWTPDLVRRLQSDKKTLVVAESYGRLSAYDFALPVTRRGGLRWFQDQYSYYAVRHPDTPIHFVGHSNGTYMFGHSIRAVRSLRFDRVYLAGSVLPRTFPWRDHREQINVLVNACGSKDKPVGWLCSALRGLGMRDIGVGGFTGFDVTPAGTTQLLHIAGGHDAGVTADRLPMVAEFLRTGVAPTVPTVRAPESFGLASRTAPYLAWGLVLAIAAALTWTILAFTVLKLVVLLSSLVLIYLVLKVV